MTKITIFAVHELEMEKWVEHFEKRGINASKCIVCGKPIVKTERSPYLLKEKLLKLFRNRKFYTWNISAIVKEGFICDSMRCLLESREKTM